MILPGNEAKTLPKIVYEEMKGTVLIQGRSIATTAEEYFDEFVPYFKHCVEKKPMDLTMDIDLEYFNTKSSRIFVEIFEIAKTVEEHNHKVTVNWYYEEGDENMLDSGADYEYVSKLKFNYIKKPE